MRFPSEVSQLIKGDNQDRWLGMCAGRILLAIQLELPV